MDNIGKLFWNDNVFLPKSFLIPAGEIRQITELSVTGGFEVTEHIQYCDEITYVISGSADFFSGDCCDKVKSGQIHFIKKGVKHKIIADKGENLRYICIGINPEYSCEGIKGFYDTLRGDCFVINDDGSLRDFSKLLLNELYINDESNKLMINMFIIQIFISMSRIIENRTCLLYKKNEKKTAQHTIYHLLRYIDREYMNISDVKSIASALSYSEYYISHLFREKMGMSIKEYILKKKISAGSELLKTTDMSIKDISEYLNFGSPHTFSQVFKRLTALSPTEYKRNFCSKPDSNF